MTAQALLRVWLASLVLAVAAVSATVALGWNKPAIVVSMGAARIALIGSSLIRNAVPLAPIADGLLGDGRDHVRIGVAGLSEEEAVTALNEAVAQGADTVFLEANVLVVDLPRRGAVARATPGLVTWWTDTIAKTFRRGADRLRGRDFVVNLADEHIPRHQKLTPRVLSRLYPLRTRALADPGRLAAALDNAHDYGARVILVVPPRARSAQSFMGGDNQAEVQAAYERIAATYGLELWVFGPAWPDELFVDAAHVSRDGRARFAAELRQRYQVDE